MWCWCSKRKLTKPAVRYARVVPKRAPTPFPVVQQPQPKPVVVAPIVK